MQLFINLHDDALHQYGDNGVVRQRASGMVLQGPTLQPIVIDRAEQKRLCGVLFSPGGAYPFLGIPVSELGSELVDLSCLGWGDRWALQEQLAQCRGPNGRLDLLEAAFLARAPVVQDWDRLVDEASDLLRNGWRVQSVAAEFGTTQQTLITRFRERTSLTPQTFSRIERFQRLIRTQSDPSSWADAAFAAGYSDQSHMVREFKCFTGITPTSYTPARGSEPNHLPVFT